MNSKIGWAVSNGIKEKMKDPEFKKRWIEKCKKASIAGRKKVNFLLQNNPDFRDKWVKNCSRGGIKTFRNKAGAFDISNLEARRIGALRGLRNTKRKVIGPKNEDMYNNFERHVAVLLLKNKLDYVYEKNFKTNGGNGFTSCDFEIRLKRRILLIEATCWDKHKEKALRLNKKLEKLKGILKDFDYIVVAPTKRQSERYSEFLDKEIVCYSSFELDTKLKKIASSE